MVAALSARRQRALRPRALRPRKPRTQNRKGLTKLPAMDTTVGAKQRQVGGDTDPPVNYDFVELRLVFPRGSGSRPPKLDFYEVLFQQILTLKFP